jgi:HSP20 family protein
MAQRCNFFFPDLSALRERAWRPAADVYRIDSGWLVKLDLAGIRASDVRVAIADRRLIVTGERKDWLAAHHLQLYSMEIVYDRFERVVEFPCELKQPLVEVDYRDGLLLITVRCDHNQDPLVG